jgi:hypothetical protein
MLIAQIDFEVFGWSKTLQFDGFLISEWPILTGAPPP